MTEIIFEAREDEADGGYVATALGHAIATQGETMEELRDMVRDAVQCHFGDGVPGEMPKLIRLHFVRDVCDWLRLAGAKTLIRQVGQIKTEPTRPRSVVSWVQTRPTPSVHGRRMTKIITMGKEKKIALVAHDHMKRELVEWAKFNRDLLAGHTVFATGTTGTLLEKELGFSISKLQSGPLGGDQQIGAKIVDGEINFLIFFWDPLETQPHDTDVKALLRMAVVWNVPIACDRATADFIISSPLMDGTYERIVPDYDIYRNRKFPEGDSEASRPRRSRGGE